MMITNDQKCTPPYSPYLPLPPLQICGELHYHYSPNQKHPVRDIECLEAKKVLKETWNLLQKVPLQFLVIQQSVWALINVQSNHGHSPGCTVHHHMMKERVL